mmetsp:Transcript_31363/g.100765  ORF Transcript_31363/g.100765 Transcript_31363/m.100765 type:complete len:299 (+) Transcript_31363:209-1105(+)
MRFRYHTLGCVPVRGTRKDYASIRDCSLLPVARPHFLQGQKPEVDFFRALRSELYKSSRFFKAAEHVLELRRGGIDEALHQLQLAQPATSKLVLETSSRRALYACVSYYRDLLLLENFAIINYCGFSKILKKHDKRTGQNTRTRFMRMCVAPQPFTHYPKLLEMIKEAEALYRSMSDATTRSMDPEHAPSYPQRLTLHRQEAHPVTDWLPRYAPRVCTEEAGQSVCHPKLELLLTRLVRIRLCTIHQGSNRPVGWTAIAECQVRCRVYKYPRASSLSGMHATTATSIPSLIGSHPRKW